MQHHASHDYLPSEAHPLNKNRAPSPSTPRSKIRRLKAMASFTKPLNVFHRRRTTNNLTSSTSTNSLQSQPVKAAVNLQKSTTYQGSLHSVSEHGSYEPSNLSASSSVSSFGWKKTDNENTPRRIPRQNDSSEQETPRGALRRRRITSLEQQRWVDPSFVDNESQPTPTKSSKLDSCPLRKAIKEARTPGEHQGSSRITGTQRRHIPLQTSQVANPKRAPVVKSYTAFEHQRYFTDPVHKGALSAPRRDSSLRIEHRQLLQPLPPPFPKSQTMGVLVSGSGEFAVDPLRSHPSRSGEHLVSSFQNRPSLGGSRESLTSSVYSRSTRGTSIDHLASMSHNRPSPDEFDENQTPSWRSRPSIGETDEPLTPSPQMRIPFVRLKRGITPILRTRPSAGVIDEHKTPEMRAGPSIEREQTPRTRLRKTNSGEGDFNTTPVSATSVQQIKEAMPSAYWCGRFMTLNDRFRNEEFNVEERHDFETERYALSTDELRVRRVFIHLDALCLTEEARASLMEFQEKYALMNETPAAAPVGRSLKEKTSFFDKIMGKRDVRKEVEKGTAGKKH
ncbi:MAG: hypothetical protein M1812_006155 [Candelaria pacifica]|nr:MAG: hypothetical protein M1812_006155 [Candelaria pacifica]